MARRNEQVATLLENIAKLLALKGESPFRILAFVANLWSVVAVSRPAERPTAARSSGRSPLAA
jgi:DNA polymerase/3'-5' exonuclease PolX